MNLFRLCNRDGGRRRLRGGGGGVHYDSTSGVARPTAGEKRQLIRGEWFASRVSGTVRPQDHGGGATPIAAPRLMKTDNISNTTELTIPTQRVLSPEPVVAPSAGASPDLSREGPFDPNQDISVSGAAPLVLDNVPGCQYRMASYGGAHLGIGSTT